jgi:hypothetical protein
VNKKVELFVTEKGHASPNKWKKGDKIKVHPQIAKALIEKDLASEKEVKPKSAKDLADEAALKQEGEKKK